MSRFLQLVFVCAVLTNLLVAQEYKRPTSDVNVSCGSEDTASSSMSAVYTGKSGVGPVTSPNSSIGVSGSVSVNTTGRLFSGWSTTKSYTSLTLNVNRACDTSTTSVNPPIQIGLCSITYSYDAGATWNSLYFYSSSTSGSDPQATTTIPIPSSVTLSNLQVQICAYGGYRGGSFGGTGQATLTIYDLWTVGLTSGGGTHPVIISQ